jgi:hypothetical protein
VYQCNLIPLHLSRLYPLHPLDTSIVLEHLECPGYPLWSLWMAFVGLSGDQDRFGVEHHDGRVDEARVKRYDEGVGAALSLCLLGIDHLLVCPRFILFDPLVANIEAHPKRRRVRRRASGCRGPFWLSHCRFCR